MKRRLQEFGAATALTGSVLAGAACATEADSKGAPSPEQTTISATGINATETILPPTPTIEALPDSPKNRIRRCIFESGRTAILAVMRAEDTHVEQSGTKTIYQHSGAEQSRVIVDTSSGKPILDYEFMVTGSDGTPFAARGEITLNLSDSGSVDDSLENVNAGLLTQDYDIADRSAVFDLEAQNPTIKETFNFEQADTTCDVVYRGVEGHESFQQAVQDKYGA